MSKTQFFNNLCKYAYEAVSQTIFIFFETFYIFLCHIYITVTIFENMFFVMSEINCKNKLKALYDKDKFFSRSIHKL